MSRTSGSRSSDDDRRSRVGVLLTHDRNRELLGDWLDATYDVIAPTSSDAPFSELLDSTDLLLLDAGAYERHADFVDTYRTHEDRLFRPVLLVAEGDPKRLPEILTRVDDVVRIPVAKAVLHARIRGLLARRSLSRDVAASEDRFRTLFDLGPDPAVVVDGPGTVVESNAAFHEMFDVTPGECRGRPLSAIDAFDPTAVEFVTADATARGRSVVSYRRAGGALRYAECTRRVLNDDPDTGRPPTAASRIVVFRDITERIQREQELERQIDRLDEFAGVLAHEIRNPLSIAIGWLDQARAGGDPEAFDRVEAAHGRIGDMIEALLQLARQGHVIGDRSAVPLVPLVVSAWDDVLTADASLVITADLTDQTVTGDRKRLQEIFTNLFRNAIDHGGPGITVEVGVLEDGHGIYVADDGPGLGELDRDQLFEPGYTTSATGTGFGLAIVEQIADAHGWTTRATDAENGGARFELQGIDFSEPTEKR